MSPFPANDPSTVLFNPHGRRKYVSASERPRFLAAALRTDAATRTFCQLLAFTGCRISEGLALTAGQVDQEGRCVVFRTLKRRKRCFRAVPIPAELLVLLLSLNADLEADDRIWSWSRQTAWRRVRTVMRHAGIEGPQAMPKGLRHGFGIAAAENNVPPGLTKRWMGHARFETTAIYQDAVGVEERSFAARLWDSH